LQIKPSSCLEFLGPNPSRGAAPPLLFNLKDDQGKKRNRIAEQPGIAEDLQRKLSAWAAQLDSAGLPPGPLNEQERKWYRYSFGLGEPSRR